ncbi:hypothetical protein Daes_0541 [Pseudodesulfovibrio aespoeensis Aspo-2]|uniref:Uncharacterized protein n=1 Tax=Pseudodesulfovibrio aespoeensis (strain ATCC 700646 / DSM 10631 / Aspo-2) TaxID=643562 RepID=E6VYA3_PSEA9|nr:MULTISPECIES: hypothetical protein [Pseudodesulfovibrio]ADU61561.1 hypothetical protein Daes_0541 [Pseudodesulfovibrio aespoeensis Aspo-2]
MHEAQSAWRFLAVMVWAAFSPLMAPLMAADWAQAQDAEHDYSMDFAIPEPEGSRFEVWGQAELRAVGRVINDTSAIYRQRYYDDPQEDTAADFLVRVKPELSFHYNDFSAYARPRADVAWSQLPLTQTDYDDPSVTLFKKDKHWAGEVLAEEAFVTWRPAPAFTLESGKKVLKWGKGYAWNPVAFASRAKDVDDPDQTREGYVMAYADAIASFDGPLKTVAFTPVVLPVTGSVNQGLADDSSLVYGTKAYLLLFDVDIDMLVMAGDNYDTRAGVDFAANLMENLAIHGEFSTRFDFEKTTMDRAGNIGKRRQDALSFLLGLRYLTENDTTYLAEYYHNGEGYSHEELSDYYAAIDAGYADFTGGAGDSLLKKTRQVSNKYNKSSSGQDYLYFRVSQKEPFGILYLTPTLTTILNLGDGSFTLNPEATYMLTPALEIRPRLIIPVGGAGSEYGEKLNSLRGEMRLTWYF